QAGPQPRQEALLQLDVHAILVAAHLAISQFLGHCNPHRTGMSSLFQIAHPMPGYLAGVFPPLSALAGRNVLRRAMGGQSLISRPVSSSPIGGPIIWPG